MDAINDLRAVTETQDFIRGSRLSEIVHFPLGVTKYGQEQLMNSLEKLDANWPAGRTRMLFQILMSEHVTRDEVIFSWTGGEVPFNPERSMSINGEATDGIRPPYWVLLEFQRDGIAAAANWLAHKPSSPELSLAPSSILNWKAREIKGLCCRTFS